MVNPPAAEQGFCRRRCRAVHFVRRKGTPHTTAAHSRPCPMQLEHVPYPSACSCTGAVSVVCLCLAAGVPLMPWRQPAHARSRSTRVTRFRCSGLLAWPWRSTSCRASSAQSRSFISTAVLLHTRSAQPHSRRPARPDRARVAVQYESARLGGGRRVLRGVYICSRCENSKTLAQRQVFYHCGQMQIGRYCLALKL